MASKVMVVACTPCTHRYSPTGGIPYVHAPNGGTQDKPLLAVLGAVTAVSFTPHAHARYPVLLVFVHVRP